MPRLTSSGAAMMALLLTGCAGAQGEPSGAPSASPAASAGAVVGDWVLDRGSVDGVALSPPAEHRITMTITGRQLGGVSACNSYGGEIVMRPDGIHLEHLGQTAMACEDPAAMTAESTYIGALQRVRHIERDGDELVARGDGVELRFAALPPPPTAELLDTRWTLETVLVGDVAAAPVGAPATLELRPDGTFSGSTGCRTFSGQWIERGDQILATSWGLEGPDCPPDLRAQDDHVVSVIGDGFVPSVDGELLTLLDPGGVGLVYRSGE